MNEENIFLLGILTGIIFVIFVSGIMGLTPEHTLAQKCAETQGRYDFCVQKINWEVRK